MKIIAAFIASAVTALIFVTVAAVIFFPAMSGTKWWEIAIHFGVFGSVVILPLTLLAAIPYLLFRYLGWLNRWSVLLGGAALGLAYPTFAFFTSSPELVRWWAFAVCGAAGALAALVFWQIAGFDRRAAGGL